MGYRMAGQALLEVGSLGRLFPQYLRPVYVSGRCSSLLLHRPPPAAEATYSS